MQQSEIDSLRHLEIPVQGNLIGHRFQPAASGKTLDVVSPIDGRILTTLADAGANDVDDAVCNTRACFASGVWADAPPAFRKAAMLRWADLIEKHALELAVLGVRDNGTEIVMALKAEPGSAVATIRYYAEAIDKIYGEIAPTGPNFLGLIHKQPKGVVGAIVPWNFPMMIAAWKIAPAMSVGNSVVLKPSEAASLSLLRMAALALEAGIPPGVLNVVTGGGATGAALARHMDVDVLAFTGSGNVGRRLLEYSAASNMKPVYLELGGKSPNIVFADAPNIQKAAQTSTSVFFRNSSQVCVSASRLIIQDSVKDEFLEHLLATVAKLRVGDPLDLSMTTGAIATQQQLEANLRMVEQTREHGAKLLTGGQRLKTETGGYFMAPTVFDNVTPQMPLFQHEVFGPILSVTTFQTEDEALALANDSSLGLSSAVWTSNLARAHRMIKSVQAGVVMVNSSTGTDNTVPLSGVKQSGHGYDKSLHAIDKYVNHKSAWIDLGE